jgi:hypothetical protein
VTLLDASVDLDELFLWEAKRKVRTDRTVSLNGRSYEVAAELVRHNVLLRYDPSADAQRPLQVWYGGKRYGDAKPVDVHANCFVKRESSGRPGLDFTRLDAEQEGRDV